MEKIGIDVHKVATEVCILTENGEYEERRIRTERDPLTEFFGDRSPARILSGCGGGRASGEVEVLEDLGCYARPRAATWRWGQHAATFRSRASFTCFQALTPRAGRFDLHLVKPVSRQKLTRLLWDLQATDCSQPT